MSSRVSLVLLIMSAAACSGASHEAADTARSLDTNRASHDSVTSPLTLSEHGIGTLRAGMTRAEAAAALHAALTFSPKADTISCTYLQWLGAPEGVNIMMDSGRVARVEVRRGSAQTREGAGIGDSEARIQQLYAGRVSVQPHKYTGGHYLTIAPALPADSAFRIVFETDSGRVTKYRAGKRPQVEYVEGCG